jgi:hypothetical protein
MATLIDDVVHRFEEKAKAWEADVARLRTMGIREEADMLAFCAREVRDLARDVKHQVEELGPVEYAALHGCSPQTVREWCAKGQLAARRDATGDWRIPKDAVRTPTAGTRAPRRVRRPA